MSTCSTIIGPVANLWHTHAHTNACIIIVAIETTWSMNDFINHFNCMISLLLIIIKYEACPLHERHIYTIIR